MFVQAEHCRTSLESARTLNTELTEQIEQYAQKLKDVSSLLSFFAYYSHHSLENRTVDERYLPGCIHSYVTWLVGGLRAFSVQTGYIHHVRLVHVQTFGKLFRDLV